MKTSQRRIRLAINVVACMTIVAVFSTAFALDGVPCGTPEQGNCNPQCLKIIDPDTFSCCSTYLDQCCQRVCVAYMCFGNPPGCANTVLTAASAGTPGSGTCVGGFCQ